MIITQKREQEKRNQHFLAAIQGIDMSKHEKNGVEERLEEARRRAQVKLLGAEEVERQEFAELGFGFETD